MSIGQESKTCIFKSQQSKVINKEIYCGISYVICNAKSTLLLLLDAIVPSNANSLRYQVCKVVEVKLCTTEKTKNTCFIQTATFHTQLIL